MKKALQAGVVALLVLIAGFLWWRWKQDEPRRISLEALQRLHAALSSPAPASLLETIVPPVALQSRTAAEQVEFVQKALRDEISLEGITALKREGAFGPLQKIFPAEAETWAKQAGVSPDECVAFKLEKNGLLTEVVLHVQGQTYRIVRCNNVKQLAGNF